MNKLGRLGSVGAAVTKFIVDHLESDCTRADSPRLYRVEMEFSLFLQRNSVTELVANEMAEKQRNFVWERLRTQISRWEMQGVMPPYIESTDSEDTLLTWRHGKYLEVAGAPAMDANFFGVYRWLGEQRESDFIVPCACYLHSIGCNPIFVTDGAGDEGIDCIGIVASGGLRGTAVLVQAKSSAELLGAEELLQEFGKSIGMRRTTRYLEYLRALGVHSSRSGAADLYVLISNSDLKKGSVEAAQKLGALVRSRRQLAQSLSSTYTLAQLTRLAISSRVPRSADLTLNVASMLDPLALVL